jgi:hypothetical protein
MAKLFIIIFMYYYLFGMTELSDDPLSSFHDDNDALFLHGNLLAMDRILETDLHQWLASRPLA